MPFTHEAALGSRTAAGQTWMPYMLSAAEQADGSVDVAVPEAVLDVVQRYRFQP